MSESLPNSSERHETSVMPEYEDIEKPKTPEHAPEKNQEDLSKALESLQSHDKEEAKSKREIKIEKENKEPSLPYLTREIKTDAFKRILRTTQARLKGPDKVLSKVIHNKTVSRVSAIGEKTVARPWGLLVGGIFAFFGSITVLYMAKHYGFKYNLLLLSMLFVVGFIVGTALELILRAFRHKR